MSPTLGLRKGCSFCLFGDAVCRPVCSGGVVEDIFPQVRDEWSRRERVARRQRAFDAHMLGRLYVDIRKFGGTSELYGANARGSRGTYGRS